MKLLLDECVTRYLKADLAHEHTILTVDEAGYKGLKNGELLKTAVDFEVLVTVDKGIKKQHNFAAIGLGVLLLRAKSNRYANLKRLIPDALKALKIIKSGEVVVIE